MAASEKEADGRKEGAKELVYYFGPKGPHDSETLCMCN